MRNNIIKALKELENDNSCRVLFACESGSRAWGFASPDSDYDVRFIYYKPVDWYLRIDDVSDTINAMLPNDLDLCGWELQKTMKLFSKSNLCLFEWLNSPEIYFSNEQFHKKLMDLMPDFFDPKKALHHYLSTANKMKEKHLKSLQVNIKKIFYVIRPLLACNWVINNRTMPPTAFSKLYPAEGVPETINEDINELLVKKNSASEKDVVELSPELFNWIELMISRIDSATTTMKPIEKPLLKPLNELLCSIIK